MKKIDPGQTITILANIGVIVGIVFLALELGQNQDLMRAQTRNELSRTVLDLTQFSSREDVRQATHKANQGERLTWEEEQLVHSWATNTLRFWENMHYQYRQDLYEEQEFQANLADWRERLNGQSALRGEFCSNREQLSAAFFEAAEALLETPCAN